MVFVTWKKNYSVGIAEIDLQHRRLFSIINSLHDAMRQGKGHTLIGAVLAEMADYATHHFSTEERYFRRFKFAGAREHAQAHQAFAKRVAAFRRRFAKGDAAVTIETLSFLVDWQKEHVENEDRKYIACFREHGLR